ncbi:unnamed protein product [Schistosoma turkestanicum]|nr:unnamed protein product [Schistosoma turkestanicum]
MNKLNDHHYQQQQGASSSSEIEQLHDRIIELGKSRLNSAKVDLLQIKENLDQLTYKGNSIDEQLTKYEQKCDTFKQMSTLVKISKLDDLMTEAKLTDITLKWNELFMELERFKHDTLDPYEVLHNKATLKPSKDYVGDFTKRYDKCLTDVKVKLEESKCIGLKLGKLKEKIEEFNGSFEAAYIKYKKLLSQLRIEFNEQYTHCKLSEICYSIQKAMQQSIVNLKEFNSNIIEKLQTTYKDISSQAVECELELAIENSLIFSRFNALKSELTDYIHDLDELNNELISLTTDLVNYEQWFENLEKQYQQTKTEFNTTEKLLFSQSTIYQSITVLSMSELENESNNNSTSLGQLNLQHQKSLQTLLELRKTSMEYNPPFSLLSERLSTLIRQIISTHKSVLKMHTDIQSDRQIGSNRSIDIIDQNCHNVKESYQHLINLINQDANTLQIKSTYLTRLIQSNKDLDIWIKEFLQLINQMKQEPSDHQNRKFYLCKQNDGRTDQIQLKLDIGKTYIQPIHEWVEQLKQNQEIVNKPMNDLLNQQIKRSNQIYQYAMKLTELMKHEQNQHKELMKNVELEFHSIEQWFKQWQEKYALMKLKITKLLTKQTGLDDFNKIDMDIDQCIDSLTELHKELTTKQTLLSMTYENDLNATAEFNHQSAQLKLLFQEFKENTCCIEQNMICLKCVKVKFKELCIYLKKAKQWTGEISEQLPRIRDGKSPIRISPYPPSRNETNKPGYWKTTTYPTDIMHATTITTPTGKTISLRQSINNEFRSPTPSSYTVTTHLLQQSRFKMDALSNFIEEITKSASITAKDVNNLLDELEANLSELRIDCTMITTEIEQIQGQVEQILLRAIDEKQNLDILINQLNQLEDTLNQCKQWLMINLTQMKKFTQQIIVGMNDLTLMNNNQTVGEKIDQLLIDIYCPLDGIIQNYQVFQSELMSQKSELIQLNSLCESIQEKTNDSGVRNALNQLLVQYHSLIKSCEDVLSKLQLVFMENREFQVLCNNIRNFLNTLTTELKSINTNDQDSNLSGNHLNTIASIREKLRSSQPKLLELSDRADRICRASSTAALTINQMFVTHASLLDSTDSINSPVFLGYNQHHQHQQLSTNRFGIDNLQTETVGSRAKRQLNEFRKEFSEISQQITEYQEKLNHLVNEQKNLSELSNDLRSWMEKTEKKLNILEAGKLMNSNIEESEQNIKPLMHGSMKFNENNWNSYIQQVTALNKELNEYSQKNEQICETLSNTTKPNGQTNKLNQLTGRFTEMKERIQQFVSWINTIQQNYTTFRESAQTTERWMSSINFRLMSAGHNHTNTTNNNNNNLTGNLTAYQDSTTQIDQLLKEIDKEGKNLLENTHHLVHLLIHIITKDQLTMSKTKRICESATCSYREIPMDHSIIDNWKYLVNSSNEEKLFDKIVLDSLERNKEIQINYMNIHSNAQSIKNRLDDQLNRFKAYIDTLNSTATFILNDLQSWWKRLSVISQSSAAVAAVTGLTTITNPLISTSDPISSNVTGYTSYPNKSFINYQIDRLKQLTIEKPPTKAVSLEDVGHQLAMTLAMQSQLITMKRELSTLAYKCGMSSMDIEYISQEADKSMMDDNKGNSSDQNLLKLLARHVQNAIEIENRKLECHIEQLRELRIKWENYVKERDTFGRWLSERQTACHHLLELRSKSTQPEDEESRALEFIQKFPTIYQDFLHSLEEKQYQINELTKMHQELVQHNTQIIDPLLDRLSTEFKNLLNQTTSRIRRVEKAKNERKSVEESHSEYRGKIPILPEKAEALVHSSAKTLKHTKLLHELAKSVNQLKNEVITGEVDAQRNYLIDQRYYSVPSNTPIPSINIVQQTMPAESIRKNLPPLYHYHNYYYNYPEIQLTNPNQSTSMNRLQKVSLDDLPNWCIDDVKNPPYRYDNFKQTAGFSSSASASASSLSHQFKHDLVQSNTTKSCTYSQRKDGSLHEKKRSNTPVYSSSSLSTSYKSSIPKPDVFMKSRSPKKANSSPTSRESRPTSKSMNIPYDTRKRIISRTESPIIKSRQMTTSSTSLNHHNIPMLRTKSVAK